MKNLKYQKFIIIFIFILSLDKSIEDFCGLSSCTIYGNTNTYSVEVASYDTSIVRPKYIQTGNTNTISCYLCPAISPESIYTIDANGNCFVGQCPDGGKILDKTNECTSLVLNNLYLLGDVYYRQPQPNTICDGIYGTKCVCSSYYYTEYLLGNKKRYTCLNSLSAIPSIYKYYNYKTN